MKKSLLALALAFSAATNANAASQSVTFDPVGAGNWVAEFYSDDGVGSFLSPSDTVNFAGLSAGKYSFELTLLGSGASKPFDWNLATSNFSGVTGSAMGKKGLFFEGETTTTTGSFSLTLFGIPKASLVEYSGTLSVTAVPEPESYAMLLAGLGLIAGIARCRAKKA